MDYNKVVMVFFRSEAVRHSVHDTPEEAYAYMVGCNDTADLLDDIERGDAFYAVRLDMLDDDPGIAGSTMFGKAIAHLRQRGFSVEGE